MMRFPKRLESYLFIFILFLLVFLPINYLHSYVKETNDRTDFHQHMLWAVDLKEKGPDSVPAYILAHAAWQYLLIGINLLGFSFKQASLLAALATLELIALVLLVWYQPVFDTNRHPFWKQPLILLGVSLAAPISLLWLVDEKMYLGYIGITSYQNPTILLLKPFALLQFIFACRFFQKTSSISKWQILLAALVSLIGTYVKPSFSICILPALAIFAAYRLFKHEYVHIQGLVFGFGLPVSSVLLWQFFLSYYANETGGIAFMPLEVMRAYSGYLGWKLLLSILFPLLVLVVYFREAVRDTSMILGWLSFIFGILLTYLFAETGGRMFDGNFTWSGEIALFILFAVSTLFYLDQSKLPKIKLSLLVGVSWLLHVAFGILYYFYCCFSNLYY